MGNVPLIWDREVGRWTDENVFYKDGFAYRRGIPAGHAWWNPSGSNPRAVLRFTCPCGCGAWGAVPVKPFQANGWDAAGDDSSLSLTPSIQMVVPDRKRTRLN